MAFPPGGTTDWGGAVPFGNGTFEAFYTYNGGGPKYLGVYFTASALENTPTAPSDGTYDVFDADGNVAWACCGHEIKPPLPAAAKAQTAFEHIVLNYNPVGHPPPGVYMGHEHIDFHFYTITDAERLAIEGAAEASEMCMDTSTVDASFPPAPAPMTCSQVARVAEHLAPDQLPPGHINVGAVEPGMGNHYIDSTAPEFNGETFTHTFIYGSNEGDLIFMEPMITMAWLDELTSTTCFDISMPEAFPEAGDYPTEYCMRYRPNDDAYAVYYRSFASFDASAY
jgi:hypothetical protein